MLLSRALKTGAFVLDVRRRLATRADAATARWLKARLQAMGPTYIKIGQFVASRRDLFGEEVTRALRELQDDVAPAPEGAVVDLIRARLGAQISRVRRVSREPLACASIGQVHLADLWSGERVAIKVRRPDVQADVDLDIALLMAALSVLDLLRTENIAETKELLRDFRAWLADEMDYRKEHENYELMRRSVRPTEVILPEFYGTLCQEDFLVMQYTPAARIRDLKLSLTPARRAELARQLMDTFVGQLVEAGVVHGDPHEGNLGVARDGRLVLYDFGNVISLDAGTRKALKHVLFCIANDDLDEALRVMGTLTDLFEIRDEAKTRTLLAKYVEYVRTLDVNLILSMGDTAAGMRGANLPVKFSGKVFRIVRVFGLLEGLCKDLDADFSYRPVLDKYMRVLGGDADYVEFRARSDLRKLLRLMGG